MTEIISRVQSDSELLSQIARASSRHAFEQVVNQYINLVHAAAVRQVRDTHLAEDVTQAVFLLLWQRAASISSHGSLGGWLLVTTHHVSRNAMKKEWRLKRRERKVAMMTSEQNQSSPGERESIQPLLDSAMAELGQADRDAIVERYFHSRSLEEVGARLGISQQAASKRITRAITKLRRVLARRSLTVSEEALGAILPTLALHPGASPALLLTVLAGPGAAARASVTALARDVARPWTAMFAPIAISGGALLGVGGIIYLAAALQSRVPAPAPAAPPVAVAPQQVIAPPPVVANQRTVTLSLVDAKTNTPIVGAQVELENNGNSRTSRAVGPDGKYVLHLPSNYDYARAICRAPGRAPMYLEFENSTFKGDLPTEYTIPMEAGTTIGGIVTNDIGDPLAGAQVHVGNFINGNADAPRVWLDENVATDAEGKWHIDDAPDKLSQFYIEVKHNDFPHQQESSDAPIDQLRRGVYETVMRTDAGKRMSGVVLGPDGKAVRGANVVIAQDRYESDKPETITDADGKFSLASPVLQWDTYITVTAKGFAPEQRKIAGTQNGPASDSKKDAKPLEIRLSAPATLEGIVVDSAGKPVKKASIEVERWRNNRALQWSTKTDSNGKFVWHDAPADVLQLNVSRKNFSQLNGVEVTAGGVAVRLTLFPPLKISGSVIDADTKEPIPAFRITYGIRWSGQQDVTWQSQASRELGNGKYEANISDFSNGGRLRVEAEGYLPIETRLIQGNEGTIRLDFELKKGSGPNGIVLSPEGKPLFDVRVVCVPEDRGVYIDPERDNLANQIDIGLAQTDHNGHFTFGPLDKKFSLLVMADEGFALVSGDQLAAHGQIQLQKWARIEGDYHLNADPAKFVKIGAQAIFNESIRSSQIVIHPTTTDANGHFVLDRIPPNVSTNVYQMVPVGAGSERFLQMVEMGSNTLSAGQTLTIHVGGKGRAVIGKVSVPPNIAAPDNYSEQMWVNINGADPDTAMMRWLKFPEDFPDMSQDEQEKWFQQQVKNHTASAATTQPAEQVSHIGVEFIVHTDGTIRADNVEPGTYHGHVSYREPFVQGVNHQNLLGQAAISFTVPATPACPTDVPLDIGTIQLGPPSTLTVEIGKPLPPVQLVTPDGQALELSTLTGKILVLHFWEMHDRKFFPAIRVLSDKLKGDPRLQIVNIGMQMIPTWAKHIDAKDHLPGLLALDKDSSEMNTQQAYEDHAWMMQGLPFVLILDEKGNVAAKVSDVKNLGPAVVKAMVR